MHASDTEGMVNIQGRQAASKRAVQSVMHASGNN